MPSVLHSSLEFVPPQQRQISQDAHGRRSLAWVVGRSMEMVPAMGTRGCGLWFVFWREPNWVGVGGAEGGKASLHLPSTGPRPPSLAFSASRGSHAQASLCIQVHLIAQQTATPQSPLQPRGMLAPCMPALGRLDLGKRSLQILHFQA